MPLLVVGSRKSGAGCWSLPEIRGVECFRFGLAGPQGIHLRPRLPPKSESRHVGWRNHRQWSALQPKQKKKIGQKQKKKSTSSPSKHHSAILSNINHRHVDVGLCLVSNAWGKIWWELIGLKWRRIYFIYIIHKNRFLPPPMIRINSYFLRFVFLFLVPL